MKVEARILLEEVNTKLTELIPLLQKLSTDTEQSSDAVELADTAFAMREISTVLDTFEKKVRLTLKEASKRCSMIMALTDNAIVRTDHCSVTSNPKPWYKIPYKREKDPEQWDEIMEGIGVSELANKKDLVRIHAPGFMDYCGELLAAGAQPPAGVNPKEMTGMELNLRITRKR